MKKVLLLGAGGLMGRYLAIEISDQKSARPGFCGELKKLTRSELDITDTDKSTRVLKEFRPDLVINAAAFCRMEGCETDPDLSESINSRAPDFWARACHEHGVRFVHLSTDYVFGGGRSKPYTERDEPGPLSVYASHKRDAERAVLACPEHLVLRLAWIFGVGGSTFMSRIPGLLQKEEILHVATGRTGGCLYAGYGARMIFNLLEKEPAGGLFHLTHRGEVTWMEFAQECKRQMLEKGLPLKNREIVPVPEGEHQALRARRPDYTVLDLGKTEALLGHGLTSWQEGISGYLGEGHRDT